MPKFTFSFSCGLYLQMEWVSQQEGDRLLLKTAAPLPAGTALLCQPGRAGAGSHGQSHSPEQVLGLPAHQGHAGLKGGRGTGRRDRADGGRQHLRASPKSMIFTMCPVAATQRMFSGCGDKETITPPLRRDVPSAWVWQPMGPVAGLHQSDTDVQASLPQLASVGDTLPSQAQQVSGQHTALRTSLAANTYCPPVPLPPPPHKQQPAPAVTPSPCCHPQPLLSPLVLHLEVEVEDMHVVHEADALADLPDKHHAVHLRQVVVIIDDPLEELTALHTVWG